MTDTTDSAPTCNQEWEKHGLFFEYGSAANPRMPKIGIDVFPPSMHHVAESKIIPLELSQKPVSYTHLGVYKRQRLGRAHVRAPK